MKTEEEITQKKNQLIKEDLLESFINNDGRKTYEISAQICILTWVLELED